jgi:hypothetical protein
MLTARCRAPGPSPDNAPVIVAPRPASRPENYLEKQSHNNFASILAERSWAERLSAEDGKARGMLAILAISLCTLGQ